MPDKIMNPETEKLLEWAKFACEEVRAQVGYGEDRLTPSWLPELEAAIIDVEQAQ